MNAEHYRPTPDACGFWIQWLVHEDRILVDFVVHDVTGVHADGRALVGPEFEDPPGWMPVPQYAIEPFLHGSIKWDACSNWDWHTSRCMQHFCTKEGAVELGQLMGRLYEIAEREIQAGLR